MKKLKDKIDEIVIKAYVKWTVLMWEVEDAVKELTDELKGYLKR